MVLLPSSSELLAGAVARLGSEVTDLCPHMKDKDNEHEIQENFCLVLGEEGEGERVRRRVRVVEQRDLVVQFFPLDSPSACLLLHTRGQHHHLEGDRQQPVGLTDEEDCKRAIEENDGSVVISQTGVSEEGGSGAVMKGLTRQVAIERETGKSSPSEYMI